MVLCIAMIWMCRLKPICIVGKCKAGATESKRAKAKERESEREWVFGMLCACYFQFMFKLVSVFCYVFFLLPFAIIFFFFFCCCCCSFRSLPDIPYLKKLHCIFDFLIWSIELSDRDIAEAQKKIVIATSRTTTKSANNRQHRWSPAYFLSIRFDIKPETFHICNIRV